MTNLAKMQIEVLYSEKSNTEISKITGLSVKQIENYAYRYNEIHTENPLKKKGVFVRS